MLSRLPTFLRMAAGEIGTLLYLHFKTECFIKDSRCQRIRKELILKLFSGDRSTHLDELANMFSAGRCWKGVLPSHGVRISSSVPEGGRICRRQRWSMVSVIVCGNNCVNVD